MLKVVVLLRRLVITYHVGTYRSFLVISNTVYILAQSQATSYMHDIARLCKMCSIATLRMGLKSLHVSHHGIAFT